MMTKVASEQTLSVHRRRRALRWRALNSILLNDGGMVGCMEGKFLVNAAGILTTLLAYAAGTTFFSEHGIHFFVSAFGFLSLATIIFVLAIPYLARVRNSAFTRFLVLQRRWVGLYAFFFAAIHVFLAYNFPFKGDVSKIVSSPNSFYFTLGFLALGILALLAATSNDWAVKTLGSRWKKLHLLLYAALVLVLVHSFNLGETILSNSLVRVLVLLLVALLAVFKFNLVRL